MSDDNKRNPPFVLNMLLATFLLSSSKKGMSAHQLHRMLGVTYKTAWFMMHRIRESMKPSNPEPLGGPDKFVEADETFIGGLKGNAHVVSRDDIQIMLSRTRALLQVHAVDLSDGKHQLLVMLNALGDDIAMRLNP